MARYRLETREANEHQEQQSLLHYNQQRAWLWWRSGEHRTTHFHFPKHDLSRALLTGWTTKVINDNVGIIPSTEKWYESEDATSYVVNPQQMGVYTFFYSTIIVPFSDNQNMMYIYECLNSTRWIINNKETGITLYITCIDHFHNWDEFEHYFMCTLSLISLLSMTQFEKNFSTKKGLFFSESTNQFPGNKCRTISPYHFLCTRVFSVKNRDFDGRGAVHNFYAHHRQHRCRVRKYGKKARARCLKTRSPASSSPPSTSVIII